MSDLIKFIFLQSETGGGQGVEVVLNEYIDEMIDGSPKRGQHTQKNLYLADKLPSFVKRFVDPKYFTIEEESWNFCTVGRTVFSNPNYMKDDFYVIVDSTNIGDDDGCSDNPLNLSPEELAIRSVVLIDIAKDEPYTNLYAEFKDDPTLCRFTRSDRGPLKPDWLSSYSGPIMTVYKLVQTQFKWFGLQTWIERRIVSEQRDYLLIFHRKLFCLMDQWLGMTLEELERVETETIEELNHLRTHGEKRGIGAVVRTRPPPGTLTEMPEKVPEMPEKVPVVVRDADSSELTEKLEEHQGEEKPAQEQESVINSFMSPAVEEVIDGSRHQIILHGYHRDIVVTLPDFQVDEAHGKIIQDKQA